VLAPIDSDDTAASTACTSREWSGSAANVGQTPSSIVPGAPPVSYSPPLPSPAPPATEPAPPVAPLGAPPSTGTSGGGLAGSTRVHAANAPATTAHSQTTILGSTAAE
jgi:hypothetical protein